MTTKIAAASGLALAMTLGAALPAPAHARQPITGSLNGVAALSASDAWAVGLSGPSPGGGPLILRWSGSGWATAPNPVSGSVGQLAGVSMTSATSGWAVGDIFNGAREGVLTLHWDGTKWTQVSAPDPSSWALLTGVAANSASDAWAVGRYFTGSKPPKEHTLALHWNGKSWTRVLTPDPFPGASQIEGVSASSASDAWAVGQAGDSNMTLHWNGKAWAHVPSPSPGKVVIQAPELSGVTDSPPSGTWAVGEYEASATSEKTLTLHWTGGKWVQVPSPSPGRGTIDANPAPNELEGVSAVSASDVWAVGDYHTHTGQATMTLRWNGTRWAQVPSPGGAVSSVLTGVSMDAAADGWAVGSDFSTHAVLLLHWNGTSWTQF